ncbi:MAG TPA: TetR/AcrR family transcriptional regulator [Ktedonobacteraceae bacterium]|nr:TetR/AcrR family transcriptional regulator [Ktedonobacteraceae bacterium]
MSRTSTTVERRSEIISAAIRVIARDGLAETTTRKIAAEASVNQAALRYYFGSKDDLLFAVLQEMIQRTKEVALASMGENLDLRDLVAESLRGFWAYVELAPELQVMQYELILYALRHPASAWLAKEKYDGYCSVVESLFLRGFEAVGKTCPPSLAELARFVVGGLDGLILQFISDRDSVRAQRDLNYFIAQVVARVDATS